MSEPTLQPHPFVGIGAGELGMSICESCGEQERFLVHSLKFHGQYFLEIYDRDDSDIEPQDRGIVPCPFCGGEGGLDKILRDGYEKWQDDPDAYAYFIRCFSCAAQGPWKKTIGNATKEWNRRVNP